MLARSLLILPLLVQLLMLAIVPAAMARTISWSGYTWNVRPAGFGEPGPSQWSDSPANARVEGADLVLSIVKDASGRWTSAELENAQHLGYGTYRWIVASDLSALDADEVLGMFTYGGSSPSNNEIDIEPSHWGNFSWPTGSATVWQDADAGRNASRSFGYSNRPPYVNQFRWEPGKITYLVTDATGATLLRWTLTSGVPTPSAEVPMINYWRYENAPPAAVRSMRISSFTWIPLGEDDAPPAPGGLSGGAASSVNRAVTVAGGRRAKCARLAMHPRRFAVSGRRHGATVNWTATATASLGVLVERRVRGRRFVTVAALRRAARNGAGRMRLTRRVGGRRLRAGSYRLTVSPSAAADRVRCARAMLRFTVVAR